MVDGASADLLSLRAMIVSQENALHDLFRQAASVSVLPTEILEGGGSAAGADLVYLDGALAPLLKVNDIATLLVLGW